MVHYNPENDPTTLGGILKAARQHQNLTMEAMADKVGITERYLYRIENEDKKPSYDILYKMIRTLSLPADSIFYPEKVSKGSDLDALVRMLYCCDERSIKIIEATVKAALESQTQQQ